MDLELSGFLSKRVRYFTALVCVTVIGVNMACAEAVQQPAATATAQQPTQAPEQAPKIPADQLDSLVAPIALYPDPLLSQTLVASTYPLELVQLQQWLAKNSTLKDKALVDAVSKQPWDSSIQAMAALPDLVKRLADDIQWTTDLGNAFLAQQNDVMDAVQRMRRKAQDAGSLKSNEQQKVETKVVENKTVVVVEQANPQVVYVPSYNPVYVYGPAIYPYPGIYYPPYTAGAVVAAGAISFGIGVAMGAAWGGGWGWGCGWGNNDVTINRQNNFNRNTNINGGNRVNGGNRNNIGSGNSWQHNPQHRGGAPYGDRQTANKFGGAARGDSMSNRQAGARQQIGQQGGNVRSGGAGADGISSRPAASNRAGGGGIGNSPAAGNRADGSGIGNSPAAGNRAGGSGSGVSNRPAAGSRDLSSGSGNRSSGFGGGSGGFSGSSARSNSSRGSSSMGSRGGGGRGGGGGRR